MGSIFDHIQQFRHASSPSQKIIFVYFGGLKFDLRTILGRGGNKSVLACDIDFHNTNKCISIQRHPNYGFLPRS